MTKAFLKNYRQSPRKVRLVADLVRGQQVDKAMTMLNFVTKRAAYPLKKLIKSAVANAKENDGLDSKDISISKISVDEGVTLKRRRARARGSAYLIKKRTSNISLIVSPKKDNK